MKLHRVARYTDDVEATVAVYAELPGAEVATVADGYTEIEAGGVRLLVHETHETEPGDLPAEDYVTFTVADVDAAFDAVADAAGDVIREPQVYDWGRSAFVRDPDGRMVMLVEA